MKVGMDAIVASGLPHEFVALAMLKSYELEVSLAIRCGQPPNTSKGFKVSPKPMKLKAKTCSDEQHLQLLAGFVPWDQKTFGRSTQFNIPVSEFKPVQLYVSLYEILSDAAQKKYENLRLNGNILEFNATNASTNADKKITFSLDLSQSKCLLQNNAEINKLLNPWHEKPKVEKPNFWQQTSDNFNDALNKLYPVYFASGSTKREPLLITANLSGEPITGDIDILWSGIPVSFAESMNHKHYNTANEAELTALLNDYKQLCELVVPNAKNVLFNNVENFARTAGIITPYELIIEKLINEEFSTRVPSVTNFLQHGPETNNPGQPEPLNKKMLHLFDGVALLTEDEDELIQFVMRPGYLERYYIYVHPHWDISKWECVIKKQIELGQHVSDTTMQNYHAYQQQKQISISSQSFGYRELIKCGMSFYRSFNHHSKEQAGRYLNKMRLVV